DLAGAVGPNRRYMVARIAAAGEDEPAIGHGGRDTFGSRALDLPERLAREWIESANQVAAGEEQLIAAGDFQEDRGGIVRRPGPVALPDDFAGGPTEPSHGAAPLVIRGNQHQRPIHGRGGTVAL